VKCVALCCLEAAASALEGATAANIAVAATASAASENPLISRIPVSFSQQGKTDAVAQLHVAPTKAIASVNNGLVIPRAVIAKAGVFLADGRDGTNLLRETRRRPTSIII
jgi:hypothetical protein